MSEFQPVLLTLPSESLAVEIIPYGLTVHRVLVKNGGRIHDVVIGPESPRDHVTQKYTNTIIGRYANRVPVGKHILERHGLSSELVAISNESPEVSLHGGPVGFDSMAWTQLSSENPPKVFSIAEFARLRALPDPSYAIFSLTSPSGDQGYPGSLLLEAAIALIPPEQKADSSVEAFLGSIAIIYRAQLQGERKTVTALNLTQHWGFNLEASLQDGPNPLSIADHVLTIMSNNIAQLDSNCLGTGQYTPVSSVPAHAHAAKRIGDKMLSKGYDDYYLFEEQANSSIPSRIPLAMFDSQADFVKDVLRASDDTERGTRSKPSVVLTSEKSGLKLEFDSNQHGVMFYSNAKANPTNGARKTIHGGSGIMNNDDGYGPGTAAFLEFHHPLAAFLYSENKDKEDTLLTSNELYHNYVRCDIKFKPSETST